MRYRCCFCLNSYGSVRSSFAHCLYGLRIERGDGIEHGLDFHANSITLGEQSLDLSFEPFLLVEQTSKLAPDRGDLAFQPFLLLTKRFRQLDGTVNLVFKV